MTDRIVLANIQVEGRHGVRDHERETPQLFEIDVELERDLGPAGRADDLAETIDYSAVDEVVRRIVGERSFRLIEALAEAIGAEILAGFPADAVTIRVRKPAVALGGPVDFAAVEIERRRTGA
jgi:dihydroneopterin aldolase